MWGCLWWETLGRTRVNIGVSALRGLIIRNQRTDTDVKYFRYWFYLQQLGFALESSPLKYLNYVKHLSNLWETALFLYFAQSQNITSTSLNITVFLKLSGVGKTVDKSCGAIPETFRSQYASSWRFASHHLLSISTVSSTIYFILYFYWSIFVLQRCVSFSCTAKWNSYTYIPSILDLCQHRAVSRVSWAIHLALISYLFYT